MLEVQRKLKKRRGTLTVTLINTPAPFLNEERAQVPLGLLYLAGNLRKHGIGVEILDLAGVGDWRSVLCVHEFGDIVGITATTPQYSIAKSIVCFLKKNYPNKIYVAGGAHPSIVPHEYREIGFDHVVIGEGETALLYIAQKKIVNHVIYGCAEDVNTLPLPAWELIALKSYTQTFHGKPIIHMFTSRGCPYNCAFCSNYPQKKNVRFRSAKNVNKEIDALHELGYERIMFMDDTFMLNPEIDKILEHVKKLGILWRCHFRSNLATKGTLTKMYGAGCRHITLGIESGNQNILDNINKGTSVEMNTHAVELAHEAGIKVKAFLMVGLPGETKYTMNETVIWILDNKPDQFDLQIFHPYEDCDIYQRTERYDINFKKPLDYDESWFKGAPHGIVSTKALTAEQITEFRNWAWEFLNSNLQPKPIGED